MTAKLRRWIDLLAALLRRQYPVAFEQLCAEVPAYSAGGQSPDARRRMFERDKKELRGFGVPIETRDIGDGELGYLLTRAAFYLPYLHLLRDGRRSAPRRVDRYGYRRLPSLTFEPDELAAVFQAARRVEALGVATLREDARSAVRKLGHDLPMDPTEADDGVRHLDSGAAVDEDTFLALSAALTGRKRVTFTYRSMGRDEVAERTVAPWGLFYLGHHWYLAAADGEAVKNFRLSRMTRVRTNPVGPGTPDYEIPDGFVLREHARAREAWELGSGEVTTVTLRVAGPTGAALAATRLGAPVPGDPALRQFQVRRPDAFARWVMGAGGAVVPVDPPAFVAYYRDQVTAALARYSEPARA
jgi:proteasome accessory factor B